jgi:hypothetical protein
MKNKLDLKAKIKTLLTNLNDGLNLRFIRCVNADETIKMKNDPDIKSFGEVERLIENSKHFLEKSSQC